MKLKQRVDSLRVANASLRPTPEIWMAGYADASFSEGDTPAWGLWVRDHTQRILRAGLCPSWVKNSNEAELVAVSTAVHTACERLDKSCTLLIIKTDNQGVASRFQPQRKLPEKPECLLEMEKILLAAKEAGVKLIVKWVPGHQVTSTTAAYLNNRVDALAVQARKEKKSFEWACPVGEAQ